MQVRGILGMFAGLLLVASGVAHSLVGWRDMSAALAATHAPPGLVAELAMGWHFAGAAMLAFGCITLWTFASRLRGREVSTMPTVIIGFLCFAFAIGAELVDGARTFALVFAAPAALVLIASADVESLTGTSPRAATALPADGEPAGI
jgi:hypothetical protein